jgi:hypothetical protein
MLSHEYLRERLNYDPLTGIFIWRVWKNAPKGWNNRYAGKTAGYFLSTGYRRISIDDQEYYASRLAYFYMTGREATRFMDHRDLNRGNDRFDNLREVSRGQNATNQKGRANLKGAYTSDKLRWFSAIMHDRITYRSGSLPTEQAAHDWYVDASHRLHGEYGRPE